MRISGLLVILLWGLVSVCGASDSARQGSSPPTAGNYFNPGGLSTSAIPGHLFQVVPSDRLDRDDSRYYLGRDGNVTCFTMHTFVVKRESPHSDVVDPAGQATCLPGSKYDLKKADELGTAPSR